MKTRRRLGLQGWLVAALLAVGLAASLAVLLVVLPTLGVERADRPRQARGAGAPDAGSGASGRTASRSAPAPGRQVLADELAETLAGEVAIMLVRGPTCSRRRASASPPQQPAHLGRLVRGIPMEPTVLGDGDAVAAAAPLRIGGGQSDGWIVAARPWRRAELAIVRRRVIIAMIVVLGLATLAGIALARVLGGRIRRLASTAATLAGGDLSARASDVGVAPEELRSCGAASAGWRSGWSRWSARSRASATATAR